MLAVEKLLDGEPSGHSDDHVVSITGDSDF
jgi:hypothetical protein